MFLYNAPPSRRMAFIPQHLAGMAVIPTQIASTNPTGSSCVNEESIQKYCCRGMWAIFVNTSIVTDAVVH